MLALELKPKKYNQNELVITKGEIASEMYFVAKGEAEIINEQTSLGMAKFGPGSFFGEVSLFFNVPRTVSIRCCTDTVVFQLTKEDLTKTMSKFPEIEEKIMTEAKKRFEFNEMRKKANLNQKQTMETEVEVIVERLKSISFFRNLQQNFLHHLAILLKINTYKVGDLIIKKDDPGDSMHFLVDGSAKVIVLKDNIEHILVELTAPTFFGEVALFFDGFRTATVVSKTECTTLELNKKALQDVVQEYPQLRDTFYIQAKEHYQEFIHRKDTMKDETDMDGYGIEVIKRKLEMVLSVYSIPNNIITGPDIQSL
jgi:CRP-like cAMP-binding protein